MAAALNDRGFTLVEILMVLGLVAILSVAGISVMTGNVDEDRYDATVAEMRQIRDALVGDPERSQGGTRTSFGYLGDLGALPTTGQGLAALQTKPGPLPAFAINTTARFGLGWNGPYLATGASGGTFAFSDKWGRPYVYTPGTTATIVSRGADGAAGGTGLNQDITMSIPPELQVATVYGFVSSGGGPFNNAFQAEINYPNGSGALAQNLISVPASAHGAFQFANVPLGPRSATIYVPTKAAPTTTIGPISFVVDRARFMIPTNLVDVNPSGGGGASGGASGGATGGSTGGTGGAGVCASSSGRLTQANIIAYSLGSTIVFRLRASSNVNVTAIRLDTGANANLSSMNLNGTTYACSGSRTFSPCPGPNATNLTLSHHAHFNGSNCGVTLNYSSDVSSVSMVTVDITYTSGCDRLVVPMLL